MATMYVIAGPNSSGKSTYFGKQDQSGMELVNADNIYKEMSEKTSGINSKEVFDEFSKRMDSFIKQGKDFAVESTLTDDKIIDKMKEASKAGATVNLSYVALNDTREHFDRSGSSIILKDSFDTDVKKSYEKLPEALQIADTAEVVNNSKKSPEVLFKAEKGEVTWVNENARIPETVQNGLKEQNITPGYKISRLNVQVIDAQGAPVSDISADIEEKNVDVKGVVKNAKDAQEKEILKDEISKNSKQEPVKDQMAELKESRPQLDKYESQKENVKDYDRKMDQKEKDFTKETQEKSQEFVKQSEITRTFEKDNEISL